MLVVMRPWPHHDIISLWVTAFLLFSIFQHLCLISFLPLSLLSPAHHAYFSIFTSPSHLPCAHTNLSSCPSIMYFFPPRSSYRVSWRPSSCCCSSCCEPFLPLVLLFSVFSPLLRPMDTWEVSPESLCPQQECSNPPSHRPASGHPVTVCVEERRSHWMFFFVWQRLDSNHGTCWLWLIGWLPPLVSKCNYKIETDHLLHSVSVCHSFVAGSQHRVVLCINRHADEEVPESKCDSATKPVPEEEPCNTHPCPPLWENTQQAWICTM